MNDATSAEPAGTHPELVLPISFQAFQELHGEPYFRYTLANLGSPAVAQQLVDDVFAALVVRWEHVLTQPNPARYGWRMLRHVVEAERDRRQEHLALVERIAFSIRLRDQAEAFLHDLGACVAELEEGMTLGAALLGLSGAKFDVMVLRYVNGWSVAETAAAMGIEEPTVRSLTSQARNKIETRLRPRRLLRSPGPTTHDEECSP
ncbi:sigma-70 family RNA polymerase sigma factor [Kitasatospora sp. NPDC002040]|uniref:RNA polymerase sigma factor n=1 Tax=Kitasatospora sp. NPDC002040 TaxID=3154661 RepID=UPI0033288811